MTPVWEANNVWLIFALVVLWTGFPRAFAAITSTLFVPLSLAAAGIVLRGCGFVFRDAIRELGGRRLAGSVFALSSLMTPFFLGAGFGAIASGRVHAGAARRPRSSWVGPTSILVGLLAVFCAAFLAAMFLVFDARRLLDEALERHFARCAIGSAFVTGALAIVGLFVVRSDAPHLYRGLLHAGLPLVILSGLCGIGVITLLVVGIVARRPRAGGGRGRGDAGGLGPGAVALPAADVAHGDGGRGRPGHAGLAAGDVHARGRHRHPRARVAVHARPAQPAAAGRRDGRAGARPATPGRGGRRGIRRPVRDAGARLVSGRRHARRSPAPPPVPADAVPGRDRHRLEGEVAPPLRHILRYQENAAVLLAEVTGFDLQRAS